MKHVDGGCEAEAFGNNQEWTCHDRKGHSESKNTYTSTILSEAKELI